MAAIEPPTAANGYLNLHARLLASSYRRWTGRDLLAPTVAADDIGCWLFEAPFALLSHRRGADPLFTYANRTALMLFELDWAQLIAMPSRLSAEPLAQAERARLLARVSTDGFIDDYAGVRISRSGRRFRIGKATVWNVVDDAGVQHSQAATFAEWQPLPAASHRTESAALSRGSGAAGGT